MALQCKVGFFCCCLWVVGLGFVCFFDKMKCCAQYIRMLHYTFFFLKSKLPLSLFTLKDFCFVGIYKSSVFPVFDLSIFFPQSRNRSSVKTFSEHLVALSTKQFAPKICYRSKICCHRYLNNGITAEKRVKPGHEERKAMFSRAIGINYA